MVPLHLERYDLFAALTAWHAQNPAQRHWMLSPGIKGEFKCRLSWAVGNIRYNMEGFAQTPQEAVWSVLEMYKLDRARERTH